VIELQGHNSRTAARGTPDDSCSVLAPQKMSRPSLMPGVKQPDAPTRDRVVCVCLYPLEAVTHSASEPQVCFLISAASCLRDDVVDLQQPEDILL
jgi:hypothetical protein